MVPTSPRRRQTAGRRRPLLSRPLIRYTTRMNEDTPRQQKPATVAAALDYCAQALEDSDVFFGHGTDNPWDEAVQLVLSVLQLPHDASDELLPRALDSAAFERIQELLLRRINERVPLPYLLGQAWFAGLVFSADERALVPRSPIAELILNEFSPWYHGPPVSRVLDLCCGGGSIGLATAYYQPQAQVDLVDIDADALALAAENVHQMQFEKRCRVVQSDLFAGLAGQRYDLVLCNPPYVDARDLSTMPAEYQREPQIALGSGHDGLDLTRRILRQVGQFLNEHGLLILEVGNSWEALEHAFPRVPFTWIEFERGGHGVCAITAPEWQDYSESFVQ